jgi:GDP-L-fucose synthase
MTEVPLSSRILVTGHRGLVGSAVVRCLTANGYTNILTATRHEMDLRDQHQVDAWFDEHRPEFVIHVAGTVGGIVANSTRPAEFIYDNTLIFSTVLHASHRPNVTKLLYLGSSCIYPRDCEQPIKEEYFLTGPLEKTNRAYALAKIAGVVACESFREQYGCNFISAMPTNLYGPGDNFDLKNSHVLPALLRKFHEAKVNGEKQVPIWGTGSPKREFLYVDDLADACLYLLKNYEEQGTINVGTGVDLTIRELAETIRDAVHPAAELAFDTTKPDGTPRKLLDVSRLHALGWKHRVDLAEGIRLSYDWFCENYEAVT